jgi:predicted outer membrane repeat protein
MSALPQIATITRRSFVILVFLGVVIQSQAQTIYYVDANATPGGNGASWASAFSDLQDALDSACVNTPSAIWVVSGTYYPSVNPGDSTTGPADRTNTFSLCNGVAIYGGFAGYEATLADRDWITHETKLSGELTQDDSLENNAIHVVKADSVDNTSVLDGFTISFGYTYDTLGADIYQHTGGGICLVKSSPVIRNCVIANNYAWVGAGMFTDLAGAPQLINLRFTENHIIRQYGDGGGLAIYEESAPTLENCVFEGNTAKYYGGAVYNTSHRLTSYTNCTFTNNTARRGAGIYSNFDSHTEVKNSIFTSNQASQEGGATANYSNSQSTITNCTFINNTADDIGGAIQNNIGAHCTIRNSSFLANESRNGGAVYSLYCQVRMDNVEMRANTATNDGGAVFLARANTTIINTVMSGNVAEGAGGGLYIEGSPCWLVNSTLTGNEAEEGGAIHHFSTIEPFIFNSIIWNNISNFDSTSAAASIFNRSDAGFQIANSIIANSGGSDNWDATIGIDRGNNFELNPHFVEDVDVNNLPSITGDFHLQSFSPAINAGTYDTTKLKIPSTDLDGQPRVVHGRIDMGAYEYQGPFSYPDCSITGAYEVNSLSEQSYSAMSGWDSYAWTVEGDARIVGAADQQSVMVQAGVVGRYLLVVEVSHASHGSTVCALPVIIHVDCNVFDTMQRVYVNEAATGNQTGLSWIDAFTDLQSALQVNCDIIKEIWVAKGYYSPTTYSYDREATFQLLNNKAIYGGFAGIETALVQRDFMNNHTELDGEIDGDDRVKGNVYNVVTGSGTDSTAILDGFTIARGYAFIANVLGYSRYEAGGGMFNVNGSPTVNNCVFLNNWAGAGAGMMNISSSPTIRNSKFIVNYAGDGGIGGGMMNIANSSPVISNTMFWENVAHRGGGGMYNIESTPRLDSCLFSLNELKATFGRGVGMYNTLSSPVLHATDFESNKGLGNSIGGGIYNSESSPMLMDCTFEGNEAKQGGGMSNEYASSPILINCMFLENTAAFNNGFGGGMSNESNSNPQLIDCRFEGNIANEFGGGMANDESVPMLEGCTFYNNSAIDQGGGGMFNNLSSPRITACEFTQNEGGMQGGGIYNEGSSPALRNCNFSNNTALNGGGISNRTNSAPVLYDCVFWGNAAGVAGAMDNKQSSTTIINCLFSHNTAEFYGGASHCFDNSTPIFINTIFQRNKAGNTGGALSLAVDTDPLIINCTFSGNEADTAGGAIGTFYSSNPVIMNSIIWNNRVAGIVDSVSASISAYDSTALADIAYSLIANSGGSFNWNSAAGIDGGHNLDTDPLFVSDVFFDFFPDT